MEDLKDYIKKEIDKINDLKFLKVILSFIRGYKGV